MEKNDPKGKSRETSKQQESRFNREDSGRNEKTTSTSFAKDKRKRITNVEKTIPQRKSGERDGGIEKPYKRQDDSTPYKRDDNSRKPFSGSNERRSYNPNFTKDNRLRDEKKSDYGDRPERKSFNRDDNRSSGDRPERKSFSRDDRKSDYGDRPERKSFSRDDRKSDYGDRPERKSFSRDDNRSSGDRPERKSFSRDDNRSSGDRPERKSFNRDDNRSSGDRPERKSFSRDDRKSDYGDRPERKSFNRDDNRSSGDRPERKEYNKDKGGYSPDRKPYPARDSSRPSRSFDKNRERSDSYSSQGEGSGYKSKPQFGKGPKKDFGDKKSRTRISDNDKYPDGAYPTFPAPVVEGEIRLNRYIAIAGKSSRREADDFIREGRVTVNGDLITEMGAKVKPDDIIQIDGETIHSEKKVYILMNKPKGFVTTIEDPHADKTVMDLLNNACSERVYPVGRLDKNSLGVLLVTNDGDLTKQLTHPAYSKKKIYQVTLNKALTKSDMIEIAEGITLEDGEIHADEINYVDNDKKEIGIEIHSGRNRIVRRIFEHFGYKVTKLDRVYFAGLTKKNLKRGQWRFLTPKEVEILRNGMHE